VGNAACLTSNGKNSTYSPTEHVSLQATSIFKICNLHIPIFVCSSNNQPTSLATRHSKWSYDTI